MRKSLLPLLARSGAFLLLTSFIFFLETFDKKMPLMSLIQDSDLPWVTVPLALCTIIATTLLIFYVQLDEQHEREKGDLR